MREHVKDFLEEFDREGEKGEREPDVDRRQEPARSVERSFDELFTERCDQLLYWPDDELLYTADNLLFYRTDSLLISFSWAEVSRGKHRYVALNVDKFYTK